MRRWRSWVGGFGASAEDVLAMAKMYGAYVGEVIRRNRGGEWALIDGQVTLVNGDERVWPIAKVFKRIVNGAEDNVYVYFKVLVDEYWTSSAGPSPESGSAEA